MAEVVDTADVYANLPLEPPVRYIVFTAPYVPLNRVCRTYRQKSPGFTRTSSATRSSLMPRHMSSIARYPKFPMTPNAAFGVLTWRNSSLPSWNSAGRTHEMS
jgi:hypothetical protein